MDNREIQLKLSIEEINKTLSALGAMPYSQVYMLIDKIKEQAEMQLNAQEKKLKVSQK